MKKLFSLLAVALLIAACVPNNEVGTPFEQGQKVVLSASMGGNGAKQMPGKQRVAGVDKGTQIDLTWNEGDQITVKVGDATAVFTLESGAGTALGTFVGAMPAAGSSYSVVYPANYNESVLTTQTYTANGFSKGLMKMSTKVAGTLDGGFKLIADNALLGLPLTGTEALSKIVLTNPATNQTYTLKCEGVTLSSTETLFYIVVPAGEWVKGFTVEVFNAAGNVITSFAKSSAVTFSTTEAMVMPTREVEEPSVGGVDNGHEWVDLGLPSGTKWATCNVGATTPEEYGDYFAWGEVETKTTYDWSTYKWCNGSYETLTKYCTDSQYGSVDNKTVLDKEDDAAAVHWGGAWRMPTDAEMTELREQCTWTWTTQNGVRGYKVSSKTNSNSIFLPASSNSGSTHFYWSSSLNTDRLPSAWCVNFNSVGVSRSYDSREYGQSVRPIQSEGISQSLPTITTTTATQITHNSAVVGGNITADGNATITERGVVYGTNSNPTVDDNILASGSGIGSFTCTLTGLQSNTTYYVRDYATNSVGTAYGVEITFTTTESSYEYVDLGLSVKWATCNVGATTPEEYGDYFAWGEVETKTTYSWATYKWCNGSYNTTTKYSSEDSKTVLDTSDDAAAANWGSAWRMPTANEIDELLNNCTWTWTTQNGVNGYKVTGSNGNSIFLPAAGARSGDQLHEAGSNGYYWSSSLYNNNNAYYLNIGSTQKSRNSTYRCDGYPVRPVCP